jgi:hypothetical protein
MDQQRASQLGAGPFPPPAHGVYDFRQRDDTLFANLSQSVNGGGAG